MANFQFNQAALISSIAHASTEELDALDFGVIGFDRAGVVHRYNVYEAKLAGLRADNIRGALLFINVAPCMNNFMVARRFEDAQKKHTPLDMVIDYVLTLRMRPVQVKLRLLSSPDLDLQFILVQRAL
ncbi:phosphonate transporter [Glaciimonas immobilis]|nr:phosphonate transporter [Glaciimonas immobilis]